MPFGGGIFFSCGCVVVLSLVQFRGVEEEGKRERERGEKGGGECEGKVLGLRPE